MAKKNHCKYTENTVKLKRLLVLRSVEKTKEYDEEIKSIQSEIDFFEYGVIIKN